MTVTKPEPRRASRRSSTFGLSSLSSASMLETDAARKMSAGTLALIVGGSSMFVFVLTLVATAVLLSGGVAGYGVLYGGCRTLAMVTGFIVSFDETIHPSWLKPGTCSFVSVWTIALIVSRRFAPRRARDRPPRRARRAPATPAERPRRTPAPSARAERR